MYLYIYAYMKINCRALILQKLDIVRPIWIYFVVLFVSILDSLAGEAAGHG